jgi:uncharacterized membrane protein
LTQRVLAVLLTAGAVAWTAMLFIAPLALAGTHPRLLPAAVLLYDGAGRICHQRSHRSFHLAGVQQPVCARCTGLYVSGAAGALAAWIGWRRRIPAPRRTRALLAAAALPTVLTVSLELVGLAHPSNPIRALSALPLGAAAGWVFVRSLRAETAAAASERAKRVEPPRVGVGPRGQANQANDDAL